MENNRPNTSSNDDFKDDEDVHLLDYLQVLRRRWRIALLCFVLIFSVVAIKTFATKPVFEAYSVLEIRKGERTGLLESFDLEQDNSLTTAIEIMKSRTIVTKVVRDLGLDWQISPPEIASRLEIKKLRLSPDHERYQVKLMEPDRFLLIDETGEEIGEFSNGLSLKTKDIILDLEVLDNNRMEGFQLNKIPLDDLVAGIQSGIKAQEIGRQTNILKISYQSTNPTIAKDIVNGLTKTYHDYSVQNKTRVAGKTVEFINQQISNLKNVLDSSEKNLQEFKVTSGLLALSPEGNGVVTRLVDLEQTKNLLALKKGHLVVAMQALDDAIKENAYFNPLVIEGIDLSNDAAAKLTELEAEKKGLLQEYSAAHPAVVTIQKKIIQGQQTLLNVYLSGLKKLDLEVMDMNFLIQDSEQQLQKIPAAEIELAKLARINQVNSELYTYLLQKQQEARISQASTLSNVEILDHAVTPRYPIKPNKKKNILLGLIIGLIVGIGVAFFLDYMDDTIAGNDDVDRYLSLPVIGTIPRIPLTKGDDPSQSLITSFDPKSSFVEAFRALRTGIHFSNIDKDKKVLLVTSSLPDEGKTTISANLAIILAQTGARVLLLGCDLRRPGLYDMFGKENAPGLADYLADSAEGYLHNIPGTTLDLISAGTLSPNPVELLSSDKMVKFLAEMKNTYDHIVIDAPPVLPVADAQVLSSLVDHVLVVLEPYRIPRKAAQRMIENLTTGNAHIIGAVLNDKSGKGSQYYGGYSYYGHRYYGSYYGATPKESKGRSLIRRLIG